MLSPLTIRPDVWLPRTSNHLDRVMMTHPHDGYDAPPRWQTYFHPILGPPVASLRGRPSSAQSLCTAGGDYAVARCRRLDGWLVRAIPARGDAPSTKAEERVMLALVPLGVMVLLAWLMSGSVVAVALGSNPVDGR
jgi:hypothetical protein